MSSPPLCPYQIMDNHGVWNYMSDDAADGDEMDFVLSAGREEVDVNLSFGHVLFNPSKMLIHFKSQQDNYNQWVHIRRLCSSKSNRKPFAFWRNEDGNNRFDEGIDAFLEFAHKHDAHLTAIYIRGTPYDIDFEKLTQTNRNTDTVRDIVLSAQIPAGFEKLIPIDFSGIPDDYIPDEFFCGISQGTFRKPCVASDGMTYEGPMICDWINTCLLNNNPVCSPTTKKPITTVVYVNYALYMYMQTKKEELEAQMEAEATAAKSSTPVKQPSAGSSSSPLKPPDAPEKAEPIVSRISATDQEDLRNKRLKRFK